MPSNRCVAVRLRHVLSRGLASSGSTLAPHIFARPFSNASVAAHTKSSRSEYDVVIVGEYVCVHDRKHLCVPMHGNAHRPGNVVHDQAP